MRPSLLLVLVIRGWQASESRVRTDSTQREAGATGERGSAVTQELCVCFAFGEKKKSTCSGEKKKKSEMKFEGQV